MSSFVFNALGGKFEIETWNNVLSEELQATIIASVNNFENKYSRFKSDSIVNQIAQSPGIYSVDDDLYELLNLYQQFNTISDGFINPLIGNSLSDYGYDSNYSLQQKPLIRKTPNFNQTLVILPNNKIELRDKVLIDLGAIGKGYVIDKIYDLLSQAQIKRFLINGSGDIRYYDVDNNKITCGLEHPLKLNEIIGTLEITAGSICASSLSRRKWDNKHHYYNPKDDNFPDYITGVFVFSAQAKIADALASCLFFVAPEDIKIDQKFDYLIINKNLQIKKSSGFNAQLYSK